MIKIADRAHIKPFEALEIFSRALHREREGKAILHLEVGEPRHKPSDFVIETVGRELSRDSLGYTKADGLDELRARIAEHYKRFYGIETIALERIVVTTGSSGGFILSFLAAFDPGDRVGLFVPCYPAYANILRALSLEPVMIPTDQGHDFMPSAAVLENWSLRTGERLDGLIVSSPNNPTGAVLSADALAEVARWCADHGVRIISDEVYHGITYSARAHTMAAMGEGGTITVNSFSKYFGLTGWRIGWIVLPEDLISHVVRLAQSLFIASPTISQIAAIASLQSYDLYDRRVAVYRSNRDRLLEALPRLGIKPLLVPEGGFYLYADISRIANDSRSFCEGMLDAGLAMTPGFDFDPEQGAYRVRISFCVSPETIDAAIEAINIYRSRVG